MVEASPLGLSSGTGEFRFWGTAAMTDISRIVIGSRCRLTKAKEGGTPSAAECYKDFVGLQRL